MTSDKAFPIDLLENQASLSQHFLIEATSNPYMKKNMYPSARRKFSWFLTLMFRVVMYETNLSTWLRSFLNSCLTKQLSHPNRCWAVAQVGENPVELFFCVLRASWTNTGQTHLGALEWGWQTTMTGCSEDLSNNIV